jgi:hypothetical protein
VGEEQVAVMHYILYAVRKDAPVSITLEGNTEERIHGMPVDLSQPNEECLAAFEVLIDEIRAFEAAKSQQDRSRS